MSSDSKTPAGESPTDSNMKHDSSFNIRTARDFLYELILPQYKEFVRHNASSRHALLSIVLVYPGLFAPWSESWLNWGSEAIRDADRRQRGPRLRLMIGWAAACGIHWP